MSNFTGTLTVSNATTATTATTASKADAINNSNGLVDTVGAVRPTGVGQVLTSTSTSACSWQNPVTGVTDHTLLTNIGTNTHANIDSHISATAAHGATGAVVGTTNTQTLTNKTIDDVSNTVRADKLKAVVISATAPSANQVLQASNATNASWVTLSGGGGGITKVFVQKYLTAGATTYTPTAGLKYAVVELVGGGGRGGDAPAVGSGTSSVGGGGGSGGYSRSEFSSATIGASQTVTVGAGGDDTTPTGGSTTFGVLLTAGGGNIGQSNNTGTALGNHGAYGGTGGTGTISNGSRGDTGVIHVAITTHHYARGGNGADSVFGDGGRSFVRGSLNSLAGAFGSGGGGGTNPVGSQWSASGDPGKAGGAGLCIITEFCE